MPSSRVFTWLPSTLFNPYPISRAYQGRVQSYGHLFDVEFFNVGVTRYFSGHFQENIFSPGTSFVIKRYITPIWGHIFRSQGYFLGGFSSFFT